MALLRAFYDAFFFVVFTICAIYAYVQHRNYDRSTHPLSVVTCKVVAIILILLSINLFISNFINNFVHIIQMKELGYDRYVEDGGRRGNLQENDQGNGTNVPDDGVTNVEGEAKEENPPVEVIGNVQEVAPAQA